MELTDDLLVHRIGGSDWENFRLKEKEKTFMPPGISVLLGGSAREAAQAMMNAYPDAKRFARLHGAARRIAMGTLSKIKEAGFLVMPDPTIKFPNHGRLIHPEGASGFSEAYLKALAGVFEEVEL